MRSASLKTQMKMLPEVREKLPEQQNSPRVAWRCSKQVQMNGSQVLTKREGIQHIRFSKHSGSNTLIAMIESC